MEFLSRVSNSLSGGIGLKYDFLPVCPLITVKWTERSAENCRTIGGRQEKDSAIYLWQRIATG